MALPIALKYQSCGEAISKRVVNKVIVLFGPTLAPMCKQCAIPVSQKAGKQRSLFDSGEVAVTSLCHSRASRLWVWLYKRETSKIACKDELDLEDALEVQLDTCP